MISAQSTHPSTSHPTSSYSPSSLWNPCVSTSDTTPGVDTDATNGVVISPNFPGFITTAAPPFNIGGGGAVTPVGVVTPPPISADGGADGGGGSAGGGSGGGKGGASPA